MLSFFKKVWNQRFYFPPLAGLRKSFHTGRYRKVVPSLKEGKTLDIGCGQPCESMPDQAFLRFLNRKDAVGLDIKPVTGPYEFHQGDINKMPFADNTFDNVVAMEVLEHIHDVPGALKEIHRVLKPGGVFVMSTPDCHPVWEFLWNGWTILIGQMWHHAHVISMRVPDWRKALEVNFNVKKFQRHWCFDLVFAAVKK